jgi:hypothetical protein
VIECPGYGFRFRTFEAQGCKLTLVDSCPTVENGRSSICELSDDERRLIRRRRTLRRSVNNIQTGDFEISFQETHQLIKSAISNIDVAQAPVIRVETNCPLFLGTRLHILLYDKLC